MISIDFTNEVYTHHSKGLQNISLSITTVTYSFETLAKVMKTSNAEASQRVRLLSFAPAGGRLLTSDLAFTGAPSPSQTQRTVSLQCPSILLDLFRVFWHVSRSRALRQHPDSAPIRRHLLQLTTASVE